MAWKQIAVPLTLCGILVLTGLASAAEMDPIARDEQALREARLGTDGPALLEFFRKHTAKEVDPAKIKALIRQMGDDSFEVREKASAQLVELGKAALDHLKQATNDPDVEIKRRAEECLRRIGEGSAGAVVDSAARLIAHRKPEKAAEVLLGYLPFAEDEIAAEEVRDALAAVTVRDGKADPAVVAALADPQVARRMGAAVALARSGLAEHRPAVEKLLQDSNQSVRLRAALGLAAAGEKKAIPVLIELLSEIPVAQLGLPLEVLNRLAKDQAPTMVPTAGADARKKYRDAWSEWWTKHGEKIDLTKQEPAPKPLGYTLIVLLDQGRVLELDAKDKERWRIDNLQFPLDAQMVGDERVLIAEQSGNRVTERNLKGDIVWQKQVPDPLVAQRLANGNTLISNRTQIIEVDKDGKELMNYTPPNGDLVMRANRLPNGELALVIQNQQNSVSRYVRLDPTNSTELQSFAVEVRTFGGRFQVLPNRRILIPQMHQNRVVEHDARGKIVWEVTVEQPIVATRLSNGNTVATSMTQNRAVELDMNGKQIWEYKSDTRVTRAFRR